MIQEIRLHKSLITVQIEGEDCTAEEKVVKYCLVGCGGDR